MSKQEQMGKFVSIRRNQLGLTQSDLAAVVGISEKTVRAIEQGKDTIVFKNWLLVANAVGLAFELGPKKMSDETRKSI